MLKINSLVIIFVLVFSINTIKAENIFNVFYSSENLNTLWKSFNKGDEPLFGEDEAILRKRKAFLEIYVSHDQAFISSQVDTSELLQLKAKRKDSAYLELFMISMKQASMFSDLGQKCNELRKALEIYETYFENRSISELHLLQTNYYGDLYGKYLELIRDQGLISKLKNKSGCSLIASRDTNLVKKEIANQIAQRIEQYFEKEKNDFVKKLEAPKAEINVLASKLTNRGDDLKLKGIMSLEDTLNNTMANVSLVIRDDFRLFNGANTVLSLEDQLSKAKEKLALIFAPGAKTFHPDEIEAANLAQQKLNELNRIMIEKLVDIGHEKKLRSCESLKLGLELDGEFVTNYDHCLDELLLKLKSTKTDKGMEQFYSVFSTAMFDLTNQMQIVKMPHEEN